MNKIAVHLANGFEDIEAVTIIDILRRAEFKVTVVSITKNLEVIGSHKIKITADRVFENINYKTIDMIILPGGMPGSENLSNHSGLKKEIIKFNKNGKQLGAICAAPIVFGKLGILKNKNATCYPGFENQLEGAIISNNNIELSENIITGKGAGVAIDFALRIVEMYKGNKLAEELAEKLIVS